MASHFDARGDDQFCEASLPGCPALRRCDDPTLLCLHEDAPIPKSRLEGCSHIQPDTILHRFRDLLRELVRIVLDVCVSCDDLHCVHCWSFSWWWFGVHALSGVADCSGGSGKRIRSGLVSPDWGHISEKPCGVLESPTPEGFLAAVVDESKNEEVGSRSGSTVNATHKQLLRRERRLAPSPRTRRNPVRDATGADGPPLTGVPCGLRARQNYLNARMVRVETVFYRWN